MDSNTDGSGVVGQQGLTAESHPYNIYDLFIQQALGRISTIKLVKVMGVQNADALAPVGFVDVKPMVNLVDGLLGNSEQHGTVFGLSYFRMQGGKNAVIMDPEVGDIGFAVVCDRDISSAKNNKDFSNPGSFRRFSISDGIYIGGTLNDTPQQYIQFTSTGIKIADKNGNALVMDATGFHFNKPVFIDGALNLNGTINGLDGVSEYGGNIKTTGTIQSGAIILGTHKHLGVTTGGGTSLGPTP